MGRILARAFAQAGHEVVVLTRDPKPAPWRTVRWDAQNVDRWGKELENADAVINLAGRSVNCRYHASNRREIMSSRVNATRCIAQAASFSDTRRNS